MVWAVKSGPTASPGEGDFYFSTSTSIADVYVTELDPAEGKMLRPPAPIAPRLAGSNVAPSWSPDGRRLAYYRRDDQVEPPTLVILSVETGEERDVPHHLVLPESSLLKGNASQSKI